MLDLRSTGLLLDLFLLLAVQFLVTLDLLGLGLGSQTLLGVVQFDLALVGQALLLLFFVAGLLGLLLVYLFCFEQHDV